MAINISCIVADDDEVDKLIAQAYLETYPFIEVKGVFDSTLEALAFAQKNPPDCLFLDIDMPEMSGIELRSRLMHIPACIFLTSYPEYAVESFEMDALDFLIKPFTAARFAKTINRLQDYITLRRKSDLLNHTLGADTIFIKDGHSQVKLQLHEVVYLEALNNYTNIITASRKYTVLATISKLLAEKPFSQFIRIHRSFAVQKNFINKINAEEVLVNNIALPVGRSYKELLKGIL
ncbi:MAG: LytTR family DNA-binding domain-containing protein [Ginsengibacter sp.]